jgi:hypothetical protein
MAPYTESDIAIPSSDCGFLIVVNACSLSEVINIFCRVRNGGKSISADRGRYIRFLDPYFVWVCQARRSVHHVDKAS